MADGGTSANGGGVGVQQLLDSVGRRGDVTAVDDGFDAFIDGGQVARGYEELSVTGQPSGELAMLEAKVGQFGVSSPGGGAQFSGLLRI